MIGIIAAMQKECDALIELMSNVEVKEIHGLVFYEGTISNKNVILMKSGVGKGSAAMSTTILCDHYSIHNIINIGTAGGLKATMKVLDLVISDRVVQHDFDTSPLDGDEGRGLSFQADNKLIKLVKEVLDQEVSNVFIGTIASGDQFIAHEHQIENIMTYFPDVICAEMEAGAIAQVCTQFKIPFIIIRSLSDVAYQEDSPMDFLTYVDKASKRSAMFTKEIINKL